MIIQMNDTVEVSNLPSVSQDCNIDDLQNILQTLATPYGGEVRHLSINQVSNFNKFKFTSK